MSNQLSRIELELLALLSEELGEVQQIIGKILRHGLESRNPLIDGAETNRQLLEREIGDVGAAVELLMAQQVVDEYRVDGSVLNKLAKVHRWLHHLDEAHPDVRELIHQAGGQ
jgi:NTP pyrophosphatase (non-canonical NTP hydrolase)